MTNDKESIKNFNLPIVKNISTVLLGDMLKPEVPKTIEDVANGRPIKKYPKKWDTFDSMDDLIEYIEDKLFTNNILKADWLKVDKSISMPINYRDDVYYKSYDTIEITCYQPREHAFQDIVFGEVICELNPRFWDLNQVVYAVNEIRKKLCSASS